MNLTDPIYSDADLARKHLEALRWPNGPVCPHCAVVNKAKELSGKSHRPGLFKCYECGGHFTVTVGTVFADSKVPLNKWVLAAHLFASSKKGYSAHQLHRTIGVSYKTAWFMMHRLREAVVPDKSSPMGGAGGIVEADETYWGASPRSKTVKEAKARGISANGGNLKETIVTLVERDGKARSFHMNNVTSATLKSVLHGHVASDTRIMTDENTAYRKAAKKFLSHERVNHSKKEYSRGNVTTNTVEGYFSILKRGLIGTYHHVGPQHLKRYIEEFDFRYNHRTALGWSDSQRAATLLKGIGGKRLKYC